MIQITADTRRAVVTNKELLTVGSAGIQVEFTLSEDWNTLSKLAVFRAGDDGTKVDVALGTSLTCVVPPEVLMDEGEVLFIGIYGANGQGTVIIPTVWASAGVVKPGTEPETPASAEPTPEIWAQILGVANDAEQTANEAYTMAENAQGYIVEETVRNMVDAFVETTVPAAEQAIEDKGEEVIASIPEDYTDLVDKVEDVIDGINKTIAIEHTSAGGVGVQWFNALITKGQIYVFTNNTSATSNLAVRKHGDPATYISTQVVAGESVTFIAADDYDEVGGYFNGTGTFSFVGGAGTEIIPYMVNANKELNLKNIKRIDGKYINYSTGAIGNNANYCYTDKIVGKAGVAYAISGASLNPHVTFWNADGTYNSGALGSNFVMPDTALFIIISYPIADVNNIRLSIINGRTITVGNGMNYPTISAAVANASDGDTILIYPGTYHESVYAYNKRITLKGVSRESCIIEYSADNYDYPPLRMAKGSCENLTIHATWAGDTSHMRAYCVHIDNDNLRGETLLFDNVHFINDRSQCVGIGLRTHCRLIFSRCIFHTTATAVDGAIYAHDSEFETTGIDGYNVFEDQNIDFVNCTVINEANAFTIALQSQEKLTGCCKITFIGNKIIQPNNNGKTISMSLWEDRHLTNDNYLGSSDFVLTDISALNSEAILNKIETLYDAGNVIYDDSQTYQSGTVGAELSSQKNAISQNEESIADTQSMVATVEATTTASKNYSVGDLLVYDGKLYKVTSAIATGATIIVGSNVTQTTVEDQLGSGGGSGGAVDDVQINGTSIVSNGIAAIPFGQDYALGLVKARKWATRANARGIYIDDAGELGIIAANDNECKQNTSGGRVVTPGNARQAVFYALAIAAGDTTQSSSSNPLGTYTDGAKAAIQTMLGVAGIVGTVEGATASKAYAIGDAFLHAGALYKATASIASGDTITPGTNCTQTTLISIIKGE